MGRGYNFSSNVWIIFIHFELAFVSDVRLGACRAANQWPWILCFIKSVDLLYNILVVANNTEFLKIHLKYAERESRTCAQYNEHVPAQIYMLINFLKPWSSRLWLVMPGSEMLVNYEKFSSGHPSAPLLFSLLCFYFIEFIAILNDFFIVIFLLLTTNIANFMKAFSDWSVGSSSFLHLITILVHMSV